MTFVAPPSLLLVSLACALALAVALLWVAAALADETLLAGGPRQGPIGALAPGLAATAIWWIAQQGHTLADTDADITALVLVALFGALAARAARHGARLHWHERASLFGLAGTLLASLACVSTLHAMSGSGLPQSPATLLVAALTLTVGLRWLHAAAGRDARSRCLRGTAAFASAAVLAGLSYRSGAADPGALEPMLLPMSMLAVLGSFCVTALRRARHHNAGAPPPGANAPLMVDTLTGLPNRTALEARMAQAVTASNAHRKGLALLVVNLDGFKPVNASFGHAVGDQVLTNAARRIRRLVREEVLLARLSADEFILLLPKQPGRDKVEKLAQAIVDAVARPFRFGTREVVLSCSIGVVLYPEHGDADKLLTRADLAMQAAKRAGGARLTFYSAEMDTDLSADMALLHDFRHALENDGLTLAYQPKIDAASGQITAAEALLRWRHPERGEIAPAVFVALAERFGLVTRLGDWVIETACRQARAWADRGLNMRVAINLSAQHLYHPELAQRIRGALTRYRIEPARLTCEITESLAMENTLVAQATFAQLGEMGVHISIDDFGTGYSSLAYLRKLPAEELKIDRSFVMDLERSPDARAVVSAVIKLAHALGKRVVGEGVETMQQRRILTELRCDELQGYLFAHPMPPDDLLQWALEARNSSSDAFRSSLYVGPDEKTLLAAQARRSAQALS